MNCRVCYLCEKFVNITKDYAGKLRTREFERDHSKHPMGYNSDKELKLFTNVDRRYNAFLIQ
jgi:hypothetical protein